MVWLSDAATAVVEDKLVDGCSVSEAGSNTTGGSIGTGGTIGTGDPQGCIHNQLVKNSECHWLD